MKILQVSKLYYSWVGGVERVVQEIVKGVDSPIFEVKIKMKAF